MKYFIYAAENMYQGLHGMEDYRLIDTDDYDTAVAEAIDMSISVMEDYSSIMEDLEDTAAEMYERDSEEYDEYLDELTRENTYYIIYTLKDEYKDMTDEEMYNKVYQSSVDTFIETYCEEA
ncbi:MAG: hypothetical protein IKP66_05415 [Lachnospiraceae bacterium]|nr:hypothetical protein [Lachnospiraceae bacterium]